MAILTIVKEGDPILRKVSRPVEEITPRIITLLDDMKETMHKAEGAGLAAVQVGVLRRVVIVETEEDGYFELINPKIIAYSGEQEEAEGCLSVPNVWGLTRRPYAVTVRALNRKGETVEITGKGLLAKAFCHELDHLDGKLFTDEMIRPLTKKEIKELRG